MATKNKNLSRAMMNNQNAVSPTAQGAQGARRALSSGKFSEELSREILHARERIKAGDLSEMTDEVIAAYYAVQRKLLHQLLATGDLPKREKRVSELRKEWNTLAANFMRFSQARQPGAGDDEAKRVLAAYEARVNNEQK